MQPGCSSSLFYACKSGKVKPSTVSALGRQQWPLWSGWQWASHKPIHECPSFHPALANFLLKEDILLPCCVPVEGKKAERFSGRLQISYGLHCCNMKGVVSCLTREKVLKAFSLEPCFNINSRSSWWNLPCEPLRVAKRSVVLQRPVPEISEVTNRHTHRHTNTHMICALPYCH